MIFAETRDKPIATNSYHPQMRIVDWRRNEGCIELSRYEFLYELHGVPMHRPNRATRKEFLVQFAGHMEQFRIDEWGTAKVQCTDSAPFVRNQRGNGFIPRIQESLGNRLECGAGFS